MLILRYVTLPIAALFGIGMCAAPALADTGTEISGKNNQDDAFMPVVADAELADLRGGFAIGGLNIALGADIKTFLNGQLALHTTVSWDSQAITQTHLISGNLTMADAGNLRDQVLASGNIRMQIGSTPVYLANNGQTAITHRTNGTLQNILVNTASNVNVRQEVNATLDVGGYAGFATGIQNAQLGAQFGGTINNAVASFGR
jgi:hypothetical protein